MRHGLLLPVATQHTLPGTNGTSVVQLQKGQGPEKVVNGRIYTWRDGNEKQDILPEGGGVRLPGF